MGSTLLGRRSTGSAAALRCHHEKDPKLRDRQSDRVFRLGTISLSLRHKQALAPDRHLCLATHRHMRKVSQRMGMTSRPSLLLGRVHGQLLRETIFVISVARAIHLLCTSLTAWTTNMIWRAASRSLAWLTFQSLLLHSVSGPRLGTTSPRILHSLMYLGAVP